MRLKLALNLDAFRPDWRAVLLAAIMVWLLGVAAALPVPERMDFSEDPTAAALADIGRRKVGRLDWPQWGGWIGRNNTPEGTNIPSTWAPGEFERKTGRWLPKTSVNIKWVANLGTQTYGNPV